MAKNKVNKELIAEHFKKRFAQILEYTMPSSDIMSEEGEETTEDPNAPQADNGGMDMGGEQMTPQDGAAPVPDMGPNAQEDPNAIPPMDGSEDPNAMPNNDDIASAFNPQGGEDMEMDDTSMMQDGDEVIDITDLTDAQEETEEDIEKIDSKFAKAIDAIQSLENLIKKNDSKIDALEAELKKRNPTPIEKMNNRAANSYPFNISPKEYWDDKEKTSNYSTEDDNNGKDQEQYTITVGDVNNASDWKSISDSLSDDFLYNQTLDKLLKM